MIRRRRKCGIESRVKRSPRSQYNFFFIRKNYAHETTIIILKKKFHLYPSELVAGLIVVVSQSVSRSIGFAIGPNTYETNDRAHALTCESNGKLLTGMFVKLILKEI